MSEKVESGAQKPNQPQFSLLQMDAVPKPHQQKPCQPSIAVNSQSLFNKREQFSVSLRTQKKSNILALKRTRNIQNITKAKFLHVMKQDNDLCMRDTSYLMNILEQLDKSLKHPFGHQNSFSVEDLIQILKEMNQIASKAKSSEQYITLISSPCTTNALLVLLTKTYAQGEINKDQFIELMTHTCSTLSSVACNPLAADKILDEYEILSILNQLLNEYFLSRDVLQIQEIVKQKEVDQLLRVFKMMFEMIWLTNNFIAHQGSNQQNQSYQEVAINIGLHKTYQEIIEAFSKYEMELQTSIISEEFWSNLIWGMSVLSLGLKNSSKLTNESQISENSEQSKAKIDNIQDLSECHTEYFRPFKNLINNYLQKVLVINSKQEVENETQLSLDILQILSQCSLKFFEQDFLNFFENSEIEKFVMHEFHQENVLKTMPCVKIIGQMLACGQDNLQTKFIQEHNILKPFQWVLLTANMKVRADALWVLSNLTTSSDAVYLLLNSPTKIVVNIIHEIARNQKHNSSLNKQEAVLVLANILRHTNEEQHFRYLIKQNLLDVLHNEFISGNDHEIFLVIAIQCLDTIFEKMPLLRDHYLTTYGQEGLEHCQYSKHKSVYEAIIKLLENHFNCEDEAHLEDDLVDLEKDGESNFKI